MNNLQMFGKTTTDSNLKSKTQFMSNQNQICNSCGSTKSKLACESCQTSVCKNCIQFIDDERFVLNPEITKTILHSAYCPNCFEKEVAPIEEKYKQIATAAESILVYDKIQGKETRLLKRLEKPVFAKQCTDRKIALLRLAYFAAEAGFNGIIDVEIKSDKIRNGSYQTTIWSGSGIPTHIEPKKIIKDRSLTKNPN